MPDTLLPPLPCWALRSSAELPEETVSWASRLSISPFLLRLLWSRGLTTLEDMEIFLSPGLRNLAPLETVPGLTSAAELIADRVFRRGKIAVWGDYDVDGITATALLVDFFRQRDVPALPVLPNRMDDGYGLSLQGIEALAAQGVELLITVDCGIASLAEIARARELGMDVVVTDHHLPGEELPCAQALVNPKLVDGPSRDLAGVGVAFLLAAALNRILPGDQVDIRQFLDLVALGTVADVVPLTGQNRILVKNGLLLLSSPARPGIRALKDACGFANGAHLGAGEISFGLAPRINAAGRLGDPQLALQLLLTQDPDQATTLAKELNQLNSRRKSEEEQIVLEAAGQAESYPDSLGLVLHAGHWHQGVIGIVASRMVERFHRPCIILCNDGNLLKGSARSIPGYNIYEGLCFCRDLLDRFGGHSQAAGLALAPEALRDFRSRFHEAVRKQMGETCQKPPVLVESELGFARIDPLLLGELELLQPFGQGNPRPLFVSPALEVRRQRFFGNGKHIGLDLKDTAGGITLRGNGFRQGEALQNVPLTGKNVRLAFTPRLSTYNGLTSIELQIRHFLEISSR